MRKIIEQHHHRIGILGLALVTFVFAFIALTFLPKRTVAPKPSSDAQPIVQNPPTAIIFINNLQPNDTVSPEQVITGTAPNYYFFEGNFPVELRTAENEIFATVIAKTNEDWMTTQSVRFTATLPASFDYTGTGSIRFVKNDPSDGEAPFNPERDELIIPVIFGE